MLICIIIIIIASLLQQFSCFNNSRVYRESIAKERDSFRHIQRYYIEEITKAVAEQQNYVPHSPEVIMTEWIAVLHALTVIIIVSGNTA